MPSLFGLLQDDAPTTSLRFWGRGSRTRGPSPRRGIRASRSAVSARSGTLDRVGTESPRPIQTLYPHCLTDLATLDEGERSRDHILPRALGGSETVPACKHCNEVLGHDQEAKALSPTSWLTLLAQATCYTDGFVNVTFEDGARAEEHFGGRQGKLRSERRTRTRRSRPLAPCNQRLLRLSPAASVWPDHHPFGGVTGGTLGA
jgi:hypothetical protein